MKASEDAQGQEVLMHYNGKLSFEVFERDDGYLNVDEGTKLYFSTYDAWEGEEKKAIQYATGRCLDVGCTAGRVELYLQRKRMNVTGIDISPSAIKVCKLRGARNCKLISLENFVKIRTTHKFDTIIMFGNNFGLLGDKSKAKRLLKNFAKITSNNAIIIASSRDPYVTDNPVHLAYIRRNKKHGRMPGLQRTRIRFMQYATPWFDYLFASKKEMKYILTGTGWKVEKFIDSDDFKRNGQYIAIIRKG